MIGVGLLESDVPCVLRVKDVNKAGYARRKVKGRKLLAHRLAWEEAYGPIPAGLFVCHRCDVPNCVEPTHLFVGTAKDNFDDMVLKGRGGPNTRPRTHCPKGHPYTPGNTRMANKGGRLVRSCRECLRASDRRKRANRPKPPPKPPATHCRNGHEWSDENVRFYTSPEGRQTRECRACDRERYYTRPKQVRDRTEYMRQWARRKKESA